MKRMLLVVVSMLAILAMSAGATETILVEGSVPENASIGLAGVQYKVLYDDATGLITFMGRGDTSADNCNVIFHAISVEDNAKKSITGYNGYCGHEPGQNDVLMTDMGDGWLGFSIKASDYGNTLGMFLTVVLRQDDARNLERFFGIDSMMAPNDWAHFDGSWENRIKILLSGVEISLPTCGNLGVGDERTLTATVRPEGDYELVWSIEGEPLGASVKSSGARTALYRAGKKNGEVSVVVTVKGTDWTAKKIMNQVGEYIDNPYTMYFELGMDFSIFEAGVFGRVTWPYLSTSDWSPCFLLAKSGSGSWLIDFGILHVPIMYGWYAMGLTVVTSANDPVITKDTYVTVLSDIDALIQCQYDVKKANNIQSYCALGCVVVHELVHMQEVRDVCNRGAPRYVKKVIALSVPFDCPSPHDESQATEALDPLLEELTDKTFEAWHQEWIDLGEAKARIAADKRAEDLKKAIMKRAKKEGWL